MGVVKAPHSERDKVTLIDAHGRRLVAGVSTTGRFSVTATPGKYTLTGPPGASPYDCPRIRITVTARTITRAQIRCGRWTD